MLSVNSKRGYIGATIMYMIRNDYHHGHHEQSTSFISFIVRRCWGGIAMNEGLKVLLESIQVPWREAL